MNLELFTAGCDGSAARPFFQQLTLKRPERTTEHVEVPKGLPSAVEALYKAYGPGYEWYLGPLTILSLRFARERSTCRFVDFALTYAGMGHVHVFFADVDTGNVYRRVDGGSNSWDRARNARAHLSYVPNPADGVDFDRELEAASAQCELPGLGDGYNLHAGGGKHAVEEEDQENGRKQEAPEEQPEGHGRTGERKRAEAER